MLVSLHIENVATIKTVDIDFDRGFTVLSGETGAGKSIIIDSVNLLTGEKTNRELIRSGEENASVRAIFTGLSDEKIKKISDCGVPCDGELCVIREISTSGRNIIKCNNRSIPTYTLREIMADLITIHGQNASQILMSGDSHITYLDSFAENREVFDRYTKLFNELNSAVNEQRALIMDEREKQRLTEDYAKQIKEIEDARLKDNEEEELTASRARIKNLEQTAKYVKTVYRSLCQSEKAPSAAERINNAINALNALNESEQSEKITEQINRLTSYRYELIDIAEDTLSLIADIGDDPSEALDNIESRLSVITHLKRRYGADIPEIKRYCTDIKEKLKKIKESDEKIAELSDVIRKTKEKTLKAASELTATRKAAAERLSVLVLKELKYLDLKKVRFDISVEKKKQLTANGADNVTFLVAANTGDELKPLDKTASGGELSRIMLAIKSVFAGKDNIDTVIYDEVDAGVSGATSERIGNRLHSSAKGCQVIAVTHSAQVAANADQHILIYKTDVGDRTQTFCKTLDRDERVKELSRIIGGVKISQTVLDTAEEMLKNNGN